MKKRNTATLLAFFLGGFGIHRFYLGQTVIGILYLIFCWTFIPFIIGFIDFIVLLTYSDNKFNSKYNKAKNLSEKKQTDKNIVSVSTNSKSKNTTEININLNQEKIVEIFKQKQKEREQEIKNFDYQPIQIQRQGIQLLESLNIIYTTKNIDTLKGRFEFITKLYNDFIKASYNKRYISDIQLAIDEYKTMYYDKIIHDFELELLIKPNRENLIDYYSMCLYNSFVYFTKEQESQIQKLKKEDAKNKRGEKIINVANETITEFDKNGSEKEKFKKLIENIKEKRDSFIIDDLKNEDFTKKLNIKNEFVLNPKDQFKLTLYNSSKDIIEKIISILNDDNIWNKPEELLPIFAEYNIKCKEVEEYILQYKPIYLNKLEELKSNSKEYQTASEMDKLDILKEFKEQVINTLQERADCNLELIFDFNEVNETLDDELIKKYGFQTISKYLKLNYYKDKIISHWERKEFEDLVRVDLVFTADQIDVNEILTSQTLKTLNKICDKPEGHFKRKNKAIEFLNENEHLLSNLGKFVSTRKLFKLKPLPNEFNKIDTNLILEYWLFLEEYIRLISDTYRNSEQNRKIYNSDNSWIKEFRVEKSEDFNSNFICQRARIESSKKYSKSNPPKMPFHIGCNCYLRKEI